MQNNFSKLGKDVPRRTHSPWRWLTALLMILTLGIGQMWAAVDLTLSTTATGAAFSDWNKAYTNVIVTTVGPSGFGSKKACGVSSNIATNCLSSADSYYLDISLTSAAASSYTLEKVVLRVAGNSTGTTNYTAPLFFSNEATFDVNKVEGVMDIHYTGYDQSCADNEYTFPEGTKSCRLYRRAKWTPPSGENKGKVGTGSNYSCSNQTLHITYMEVYLKSSTPACTAPTGLAVGGGGEYTAGTDMGFEASATDNVDDATTYTWYKGNTWDEAKETNPVQAAKTNAESGRYFHIDPCDLTDAGTYWCSAANGTCEAHASVIVTVVPAGAAKHSITYTDLKGSDVSAYPIEYTEGVGIASFNPLADVTDFHFNGWSPASISADATTDQTISATWVDAYNVTFSAGAGSGTVPASFQKWEGATFTLPGQGDMVAPSNKVFDGWKIGGNDKYAAGVEYSMGNAAVEFVAQWIAAPQTIFHWKSNTGTITIDASNGTTTGGTTTLRTSDQSKAWSSESVTYNASVAADMKGETSGKELKPGGNANYLELTLTSGTFQEGDVIYVTGYNNWGFLTSSEGISSATLFDVANVETGSGKGNAVTGSAVIPAGVDAATIYVRRANSSSSGIAAIKVTRIVKDIVSTDYSLTDVKVNGTSISADNLGALQTNHSVALSDELTSAPTITFNKHTLITYDDASTKETDTPIEVTATENAAGKWEASAEIGGVTYVVTANKVSAVTVIFYDGSTELGQEEVAVGGHATASEITTDREHYTFNGWYNDSELSDGPVDLASTAINSNRNFYGSWTEYEKAVVTFRVDEAQYGDVQNVYVGDKVASINSPSKAGFVFKGWFRGADNFDFNDVVAESDPITVDAQWEAADPNHYVYKYNDAFHFDGAVYHTPEGLVDNGNGQSNKPMTTPYHLFSGAEGITSVVVTDGIFDSKTGDIQAVTALMKLNNNATSKLSVTIKSGYSATLKIKSSGYSATRSIAVSDATPASGTTTGQAVTSGAMSVDDMGQLTFDLLAGTHDITVTGGTLYIAELDIEATALATHTVTYLPGEGSGSNVVDEDATQVADCPSEFVAPEGKIFNGWFDTNNEEVEVGAVVESDMTLTAQWINHYAVTFDMQGHGVAINAQDVKEGEKATKPADPSEIGQEFGGWYTEAACENEFDFNTAITAATPLFAKWTAFDGCTLFYPATSGSTIAVGDEIASQTGSFGATMIAVSKDENCTLAYESYGLSFASSGNTSRVKVTLDHDIAIGTKITVTLVANGDKGSNRALDLYNSAVAKKAMLGWTSSDDYLKYDVATFSHTVTAEDAMAGTNEFYLYRNNSVYLQCLKVETCGDPIVFHNVNSAVVPAGKGTVALGASSVREGYATTAEYSDIDPLYEFVSWSVSGAGASVENATANPATITVGTEDAVVTLNLQLIPEKFTVNYFDGETPMGSEEVALNANPTAAQIDTDKRHFTFQGWAETNGGSVIDLNTITSATVATINLFAVYAPVDCPTSGTIFSVEIDDTKIPASTVKVAKNGGTLDVADYVIISGGKAMFINDETSDKDAISNGGQFRLVATKAVLKVELDCALQENDIIRIDNNQKWVVSTSKTKTGTYQALTSAQHKFAVTADWVGVDDLYFLYDGTSLSFTQIEVYRPAKFDVSFDMMGHGSAIADIEDVLEGSKITAPSAPTDADYAFAGWYKENTLENEWDFDNDVVTDATTLYAKWVDKSDATLKSLIYGNTEIVLEDGVFEYNIGLPNSTTSVPALTAVTNNPNASALVNDAAAFDAEDKATSTVVVTPEKDGVAPQTYTVIFTKLAALEQVEVTASTLWNFSLGGSTTLQNQSDVVLANLPGINNDETFNSQALEASFNKLDGSYFQGSKLMFVVTEEGLLTIEFGGTNNHARHLQVCTGDGETVIADWDYNSGTHQTKSIEVPAGKITLKAFEGEAAQNARIYNLEYLTLEDRREAAWVAPGELGTVCLKNDAKVDGAKVYELAGCNASGYMVFDEILNGKIQAGKPYLFEATRSGNVSFYRTIGAEHADEAGNLKGMYGTFEDLTFNNTDESIYYFSGRHIWAMKDRTVEITVPAYRCYVDYAEFKTHPVVSVDPAPGRRRIVLGVNGEQTATDVENINNASEQPQKLMINGKMFILRGDKLFDATGRLVK